MRSGVLVKMGSLKANIYGIDCLTKGGGKARIFIRRIYAGVEDNKITRS
jgi:hypothetical protein